MNRTSLIIIASASFMLLVVYLSNRPSVEYKVPFYQYNSNTLRVEKFYQPDGVQQIDFFSAVDQNGMEYTSDSLDNKIYVVDYFFVTCPGICKKMGAQMQRLYTLYHDDKDLVLVSFTSKPDEDSIPVLKEYAKQMGIKNSSRWKLLRADKKVAYALAKDEFYILNETDAEDDFVHTERFALIDKNGRIRGYYDGTSGKEVDRMVKDISLIKQEKN